MRIWHWFPHHSRSSDSERHVGITCRSQSILSRYKGHVSAATSIAVGGRARPSVEGSAFRVCLGSGDCGRCNLWYREERWAYRAFGRLGVQQLHSFYRVCACGIVTRKGNDGSTLFSAQPAPEVLRPLASIQSLAARAEPAKSLHST